MRNFLRADHGYVATLTLIAMPLLVAFCLFIIDASRGNNLHTDLQNAVDGLALAAGRELDGRTNAIDRANAAIANYVKNGARFSDGGAVIIDDSEVMVAYLDEIPASDDDPINTDWTDAHQVTAGEDAVYVLVRSNARPMTTLFPVPVSWVKDTINFQAEAVAVYDVAVCDITPMWICDPFKAAGTSIQEAFPLGLTYGRQILSLKAGNTPGAGNFGILDTDMDLRESFGKGAAGQCYSQRSITTKTGVNFGPVYAGINVRFDIYANSLNKPEYKTNPAWRPSVNVRKGATKSSNCGKFQSADVATDAMGFPLGNNFNSSTNMTDSTWNRNQYWGINHPQSTMPTTIESTTNPLGTTYPPSRYDVYRYEIDHGLVGEKGTGKNKETGNVSCYTGTGLGEDPDRRVIFTAIVDCNDFLDDSKHTTISGKTTLKPTGFASIFLTNPVEKVDKGDIETTGDVKPISFEVVDITGGSGNGSLDQFLRQESYLVR